MALSEEISESEAYSILKLAINFFSQGKERKALIICEGLQALDENFLAALEVKCKILLHQNKPLEAKKVVTKLMEGGFAKNRTQELFLQCEQVLRFKGEA